MQRREGRGRPARGTACPKAGDGTPDSKKGRTECEIEKGEVLKTRKKLS